MPSDSKVGETDARSKGGLSRFVAERWAGREELSGLEPVLESLLAQGRAAWPAFDLPEGAFVRHVTSQVTSLDRLSSLRAGDLYLACAAARGEPRAVAAIQERLRAETARALRRIDPSPAFLDEVLQVLLQDLLVRQDEGAPAIAGYRGEGPLAAWLRASAVRLGLKLRPRPEEEASFVDQAAAVSPELELIKARYRKEFERCFAEELAALPKRSRSLLRLHYVDGLGIDQLAAVYHVSRSTTARWMARERESLIAGLRKRLTAQLGIAPAELQSLMKLVVSQLHVSLGRALA